ncbi:MAG TPA: DUF2007 domain-containing protein [Syntrophales bacterium]|nr:DUF2007 domain-containing protein [Syntrophales bacterium]HOU76720.1 DUF2007 domain-containing protein [Syntrophales bacterium]HQG33466.1 DUF2007 domain-containing protein [Syntrophales bacterium]HRR46454.1 DUF2007 domain-containing protein [Syntrophales bacterium]
MEQEEKDYWREVCRVGGLNIAHIIVGRLTAEGIPARLSYEAAGAVYAITIDGLGEVTVVVPHREWERAKAILEQTYDDAELDWRD